MRCCGRGGTELPGFVIAKSESDEAIGGTIAESFMVTLVGWVSLTLNPSYPATLLGVFHVRPNEPSHGPSPR